MGEYFEKREFRIYLSLFRRVQINDSFFTFQEYSFQITMRQQWNDKRLNFKNKLKGGLAGKIYRLSFQTVNFV